MERRGIRVDGTGCRPCPPTSPSAWRGWRRKPTGWPARAFTLGSPKQLGEILFDKMQLGGAGRKTKTGSYSTDADVLEQLAAEHPLPRVVLDWRQLQKLTRTYTDALIEQINPTTGRVHTSYMLAATTDRPAELDRSQPAEHPDPHRGGAQDPRGLRAGGRVRR